MMLVHLSNPAVMSLVDEKEVSRAGRRESLAECKAEGPTSMPAAGCLHPCVPRLAPTALTRALPHAGASPSRQARLRGVHRGQRRRALLHVLGRFRSGAGGMGQRTTDACCEFGPVNLLLLLLCTFLHRSSSSSSSSPASPLTCHPPCARSSALRWQLPPSLPLSLSAPPSLSSLSPSQMRSLPGHSLPPTFLFSPPVSLSASRRSHCHAAPLPPAAFSSLCGASERDATRRKRPWEAGGWVELSGGRVIACRVFDQTSRDPRGSWSGRSGSAVLCEGVHSGV